MRTFYIFKIKEQISRFTHDNSYSLYKALENIYHLKKEDLAYYYDYFNEIRELFDKKYIDDSIFNLFKDRYNYSKVDNVHMINDYFSKEKSKLVVKRNYLCLKSTKSNPLFLKVIYKNKDIFVCDFKNRDYFWLEELVNS